MQVIAIGTRLSLRCFSLQGSLAVMDDKPYLAVFDDDAIIADLIGEIARYEGFKVDVATTYDAFTETLTRQPHVLVIGLEIPGLDNRELLGRLAESVAQSRIVLVSGVGERATAEAERFGVSRGLSVIGTLTKPFVPDELNDLLAFARLSTRSLTARDLQRATQNDELEVHYLPALSRRDGGWRVESVEALLRWNHPVRGLLAPEEFLYLMEDPSIDRSVTDFVVQRGLQPFDGWRDAGIDLGLRVNLGPSVLRDEDLAERLLTWLSEHGMPRQALMLEIEERLLLAQPRAGADALSRLRSSGFELALDNFGVGHSSLGVLFEEPFDELKIDPSLVQRVPTSGRIRIRIEALVELAHRLGLRACAVGVDHEEGLSLLESVGCDAAQGIHISAPLPASRVPAFVRAWENSRLSRDAG